MRWRAIAVAAYVAAPGLLVVAGTDVSYGAAVIITLPLSVVASSAAYVVALLTMPDPDSSALPIAAAFMSLAAAAQVMVFYAIRRLWRSRWSSSRP